MNIEDVLGKHQRMHDIGTLKGTALKWIRGKPTLIDSFSKEELSPKLGFKEMIDFLAAFEAGCQWTNKRR